MNKKTTKTMNRPARLLIKNGACLPAIRWAKKFKTPQAAWDACDKPEWMLWWLEGCHHSSFTAAYVAGDAVAKFVLHPWREKALSSRAACKAIRKIVPKPPKPPKQNYL